MTLAPGALAKRRALLIVALVLVVAIGAGTDLLTGFFVKRTLAAYAPERQVERYLDAVVAGDVKAALELGRSDVTGGDAVLSASVYKNVPNRVTSYSISKVAVKDGKATVTADVRQGSKSYFNSYTLHQGKALFGVIPVWRLDEQTLPTINVTALAPTNAQLKVANVALTPGARFVYALPGDYSVQLVGSQYFSGSSQTVTVGGFGLSGRSSRQHAVTLETTLTTEGKLKGIAAVTAFLAGCVHQDSPQPDNCPFSLEEDSGATYSHNSWKLDDPVIFGFSEWQPRGTEFLGWKVSTVSPGTVEYSGYESGGSMSGQIYTDPFQFGISGYIADFETDGSARFVFLASDVNVDDGQ
jgi:hypothetical protein